jgi:hypothetical protein
MGILIRSITNVHPLMGRSEMKVEAEAEVGL